MTFPAWIRTPPSLVSGPPEPLMTRSAVSSVKSGAAWVGIGPLDGDPATVRRRLDFRSDGCALANGDLGHPFVRRGGCAWRRPATAIRTLDAGCFLGRGSTRPNRPPQAQVLWVVQRLFGHGGRVAHA